MENEKIENEKNRIEFHDGNEGKGGSGKKVFLLGGKTINEDEAEKDKKINLALSEGVLDGKKLEGGKTQKDLGFKGNPF